MGSASKTLGGNLAVWVRVERVEHFGGNLTVSDYSEGDVIPAGSMLIFDQSANTLEVVKASASAEKLAKVNALLYNDVCIPAGCILATGAAVTSGKIYADRAGEDGIPKCVESQLPMISFIREGATYTADTASASAGS